MSQDTIEMKDYKETLSTFDEEYYKNLLGNVQEKVERYNEIGQVCRVSLRWRGKYYHLQLFFPGTKFPSRKEVEAQVNKIYPDAVVMVHYASESQPNKPLVRVSENTEERNPNTGLPAVKETKNEDRSKGNIDDPDLRRLIPEGEWHAKAAMYQSGMTDASRVKGPVGKAVDKVKKVFKKEKGGEYRAKAAMYMSGYVPKGEMTEGVMKMIKNVVKSKEEEEKKPQKAQDAGARLRRKVQRREYAAKVSGSEDLVPDDIRDHKTWSEFKKYLAI